LTIYIKKIKESTAELSDKSLSIKNQDEVYDIIMSHPEIIERIEISGINKK